ncbi:hypothetical protein [Kitasatospora cineracea]|uniref:phage terminase small subunit n=1 Tax=Kitasatospora cineracea TaxID=88074 RepID=UPI0033FC0565
MEITTRLVDALYQGDLRQAAEIRQRTAKWGATIEDRNRLRMKLEDPKDGEGQDQAAAELAAADLDEELYRLLSGEGG